MIRKRPFLLLTRVSCLAIGTFLLLVNFYGLARGMRAAEFIPEEHLLFEDDVTLSYKESMQLLKHRESEPELVFATRVNKVVQQSIAHLDNWYDHPAERYMQLVPFHENFVLNLVGRFSGLPQMERYHFSNYKRSIERGIGLCGDHAMIMSQILDNQDIDNRLLSFRSGHVVLEATDSNGEPAILDADYGIALLGMDHKSLLDRELIVDSYTNEGYSFRTASYMADIYADGFKPFGSTYEFMRKRYMFERASYVFKWCFPLLLIAIGGFSFFRTAAYRISIIHS